MRITIISDIHGNLDALETVLADAARQSALDAIWNAGDTVGYGPQPAEVLATLRANGAVSVAGNHDLAACGLLDRSDFNRLAALAIDWTAGVLNEDELCLLRALPAHSIERGATLVHGSLRAPYREYLLRAGEAGAHFALQTTQLSVVGHTHLQMWFDEVAPGVVRRHYSRDGQVLALGDERLILNPGSVGQPRDGDVRAGYAIYDTAQATVMWRRLPYDVQSVQRKMRARGLPQELIDRLDRGV